ncbi:hypothetical protein HU200_002039 [Digitaria exilis]|uniref:Uncharacterized protein n=1 Tax=Digitaria exilis TaxID=1010633 RepID=A0A835FX10_9POAL|nr:hypothetical protein HU200_002039 [Digitaria exilis]
MARQNLGTQPASAMVFDGGRRRTKRTPQGALVSTPPRRKRPVDGACNSARGKGFPFPSLPYKQLPEHVRPNARSRETLREKAVETIASGFHPLSWRPKTASITVPCARSFASMKEGAPHPAAADIRARRVVRGVAWHGGRQGGCSRLSRPLALPRHRGSSTFQRPPPCVSRTGARATPSSSSGMGNCQAAAAAAVLRLCWSTSAAEVMRANPGHYVALVTLRVAEERQDAPGGERRTLLKPKETLLLGHVYRLITTQEVTKAVQARKEEKQRKAQQQLESRQSKARGDAEDDEDDEAALDASLDQVDSGNRSSSARHRQWRPSLQSIDEATS